MLPVFDKQGHRGCRGLLPENTIPAMLKAIDLGVTTLEMDVVISKDSQVVLSHEPWMGHEIALQPDGKAVLPVEERRFNLFQMNYADIKRFDVGLKPHPRFPMQQKQPAIKPLLVDVIDSVEAYARSKGRTLLYNIETKSTPDGDDLYHPKPELFVNLLIEVVKRKDIQERVIVQSFDVRTLQYLHRHYPKQYTALLIEDVDKRRLQEQVHQLGFVPTIYSPHFSLVTPELIFDCHKLSMKVIPWTVNDKATLIKLQQWGVDGIITDYPNLFD